MLNEIVNTIKSTSVTAYNCAVAAAQTITDQEIKEAWRERNERIRFAKEQFSLTVKDVFNEKYAKRIKKDESVFSKVVSYLHLPAKSI